MELISNIGLICAVADLALLAIFAVPGDQDSVTDSAESAPVVPRTLDQVVAVAGVALLVAAGFFQAGTIW